MSFEDIKKKAVADSESLQKSGKVRILIGTATCGRSAGALEVMDAIKKELARLKIDAVVTEVGCAGLCYTEPMVDIIKPGGTRICYGPVTPEQAPQLIEDYLVKNNPRPDLALGTIGEATVPGIPKFFERPELKPQVRIVLRNCGNIDPESIGEYIAAGGYSGLVRALSMTPDQVIAEIKKSGLRGRGGAGFPTGQKWEFCRKSPGAEKYIICNADEGDPGAFMNRSLLEGDPHSVLEGMLIGAYAIGATDGYIYCRAEYPLAIDRLMKALTDMEERNLLGEKILGSQFNLHIKVKEGAGAFVCGEETALMVSIEGRRGMPRSRPPFPANSGLWGKPTNINNVETWADAAAIMQKGADWYAGYGTEKSKGTKTFALAGKVKRTGLIEVPLGTPVRTIIYDIGGGILNDRNFKAIQTGGPSGGCLPASALDLTVDYEALAGAGSIMGSGGLIVMDDQTCIVDVARYFLDFTQNESCGKCVPCRVGSKLMLDMVDGFTKGKGTTEDLEKLAKLAQTIKTGSLCGLGQTCPNPVLTTLRYAHDEYEAHVKDHKCPAGVCKELIKFYILPDKCQGCQICLRQCPVEAIKGGKRLVHVIDQDLCTKCGTCLDVCPERFAAVAKISGEAAPAVPKEPVPVTAGKAAKAETTGKAEEAK